MSKKRKCYGGFPAPCDNLTPHNDQYWCYECEALRLAQLSRQFALIAERKIEAEETINATNAG